MKWRLVRKLTGVAFDLAPLSPCLSLLSRNPELGPWRTRRINAERFSVTHGMHHAICSVGRRELRHAEACSNSLHDLHGKETRRSASARMTARTIRRSGPGLHPVR